MRETTDVVVRFTFMVSLTNGPFLTLLVSLTTGIGSTCRYNTIDH